MMSGVPYGADAVTGWQSLGPEEEAWSIAVCDIALSPGHPQRIYALTENGLWRRGNDGQDWERTGLMRRGGAYFRFFVDAVDPDLIYVPEEGVKSRDGGMTWERIHMEIPGFLIAADPVRSGRLYAVTGTWDPETGSISSLLISDDGGDSWRKTPVEIEGRFVDYFVQVHPADPHIMYQGTWNRRGRLNLFRSDDDGAHWNRVELERNLALVIVDPQDPASLYGVMAGKIWHRADRGQDWELRGDLKLGSVDRLRVHPLNGDWLWAWASGAKTAWQSVDGGHTWQKIASAEIRVVPHPQDPRRVFFIEGGIHGPGVLFHSEDGGEHWQQLAIEETRMPARSLAFDQEGNLWVGSGRRSGKELWPELFKSTDGGRQWEALIQQFPDELTGGLITGTISTLHVNPHRPELILAYTGRSFMRSEDGGSTWESVEVGDVIGSTTGSTDIVSVGPDQRIYYTMDPLGNDLFRSQDWGRTWIKLRERIAGFVVDPMDASILYTHSGDGIQVSEDGGGSWTELGTVAEGEVVHALAVPKGKPDGLYAVTERRIYVSQNRGRSWALWTSEETFSQQSLYGAKLRLDPHHPERMYLILSREVWETVDGGRTWHSMGQDLAEEPLFYDVAIDPVAPSRLYAATPWGVYELQREISTAIEEESKVQPQAVVLEQNYPNPFNSATVIRFLLPTAADVQLSIFNLAGQQVATLVEGVREAGAYTVRWDGRDDDGRALASGVYLYRLRVGDGKQVATRKLLLIR